VTVVEKGWINSIALSSDGRRLAYIGAAEGSQSRTSELRIMPVAGGPSRLVFSASWFDNTRFNTLSWSPDNRHLFFVRPEDDPAVQALWRIPADGGEPKRTGVTVRGRLKHPHLHADGRRLLFTTREFSNASIWMLENFLPSAQPRK
jgi:Tol biopolymer transport system component